MYEKIEIDNSFYVLKALVRNHSVHFTCAIHNDKKWLYLDDLYKNIREFASIELMQQQFPGGWFFAVFELFCDNVDDNKTASATQTKKISENQGIDNQRLLNELIDVGSCNDFGKLVKWNCKLRTKIKFLHQFHVNPTWIHIVVKR